MKICIKGEFGDYYLVNTSTYDNTFMVFFFSEIGIEIGEVIFFNTYIQATFKSTPTADIYIFYPLIAQGGLQLMTDLLNTAFKWIIEKHEKTLKALYEEAFNDNGIPL